MEIQYDGLVDALYFYFTQKPVARTVKINERVLIDTDADGNIIGLELLDAAQQMALAARLREAES